MKTHYAYKYPTCFEFVWNFTKIGKKFEPRKRELHARKKSWWWQAWLACVDTLRVWVIQLIDQLISSLTGGRTIDRSVTSYGLSIFSTTWKMSATILIQVEQWRVKIQAKRLYLLYRYICLLNTYVYIVCVYIFLAFESADPKYYNYCKQSSLSYRNALVSCNNLSGICGKWTAVGHCATWPVSACPARGPLDALSSIEWVSTAGMPHSEKKRKNTGTVRK